MSENKCPFNNLREPTGPKGFPIAGSFPFAAWNTLKFLKKIRQNFGDIAQYKLFGFTNYLVSHPDDVAQVFKEERAGGYTKKRFYDAFYSFFGNGLFNSFGKDWEQQRKQLQPFFKKNKIKDWFPLVVEESLNHIHIVDDLSKEINAEDLMQPLMQSIMSRILFGVGLDNEDSKKAISAIDSASEQLASHGLKSFVFSGLLNRLPTPGNLRYKKSLKIIEASIHKLSNNKEEKEGGGLLPLFAGLMNPKELRDQLFTLYFAGQETTVSTLQWVIYYLAKYPKHQERARQEILKYWSSQNEISYDKLDSFVFLNAAIDEAMRLSPAAYVTYRDVEKDTVLGSYQLKKDALLLLPMYVTHRHPDLWDNPSEYQPERFIKDKKKGYSFYPYGGGMRMCLGMHLARMEITTIVAIFVASFEFTLKSGVKVSPVTHMTLKPKNGVALKLNPTRFLGEKQ